MHTVIFIAWATVLFTLALTQRLDKPPLEANLDYLQKGLLKYLHPVNSSYTQWASGWIPSHCMEMTEGANLSAADVDTFNVRYDDCPYDHWILCRHKDSPDSLEIMIDLFGRVPVGARQWVRHVLSLPDPGKKSALKAYNWNGSITMFGRINADLKLFIHETAHSLDLLGAYPDHPLSGSMTWLKNSAMDPNVPDRYARKNQREDVAESTVVAVYDLNVPGGFGVVEPNWHAIFRQFATIEVEQMKAGALLIPGGLCEKRLENSRMVWAGGSSRVMADGLEEHLDVGLSDAVDVIEPVLFDTREDCKHFS